VRKNKTGLPDGCCWTRDRHAKRRLRYFGRGFSLYFRAPFGSPEFAAEYAAAIERNQAQPVRQPIGAACTIPGSINALIISYFELLLPLKGESTQAARRGILEKFRSEHGHRSVTGATAQLLETIILQKAKKTPHGANHLRKALRDSMRFGSGCGQTIRCSASSASKPKRGDVGAGPTTSLRAIGRIGRTARNSGCASNWRLRQRCGAAMSACWDRSMRDRRQPKRRSVGLPSLTSRAQTRR
jgi:hypothetical protein